MLKELYEAVRALPGVPTDLRAVAVEFKQVALAVAEETLRRAAIPHTALYGDINDPAALVRSLLACGIDVADAVFVTKSVIHTRPYLAPQNAPAFPAKSGAVFVAADGGLIPTAEMEQSLRELFSRWRDVLGRHGWVVCDAHTVDCAISAEHVGQSMQPTLDATHNFSHQYLVEMPVFHAAAQEAGFTSVAHRALGIRAFGHDYMSIDHFVAKR